MVTNGISSLSLRKMVKSLSNGAEVSHMTAYYSFVVRYTLKVTQEVTKNGNYFVLVR